MKNTKTITWALAFFLAAGSLGAGSLAIAEEEHGHDENNHKEETVKHNKTAENHDEHGEEGDHSADDDHNDDDEKSSHGDEDNHGDHDEKSNQGGEDDHDDRGKKDDHDDHGEEAEAGVEINSAKRNEANIVVEPITLQTVAQTILVPAEIKINGYRAQVITPRISSMVIKRHVVLGDHVEANQSLATLFSVDMAEAQGAFIMASKEWARVKKLGKNVVSGKRFVEAEVSYGQAKARLQAYGMAENEIAKLSKSNNNLQAGHFTLFSNQSGTITSDDFRAGEIIEPGRTIFDVVDEKILWVEAHVSPEYAEKIQKNDVAWVHLGDLSRKAIVAQKSHVLDETTRTLTVRLEVDNSDHVFAPRQFVDVEIASATGEKAFAVPAEAVLRSSDGDWQIFIENAEDKLVPMEIKVLRTAGNMKVITGVSEGTKVVTKGAFFVQSEIAKGGFDIHNH